MSSNSTLITIPDKDKSDHQYHTSQFSQQPSYIALNPCVNWVGALMSTLFYTPVDNKQISKPIITPIQYNYNMVILNASPLVVETLDIEHHNTILTNAHRKEHHHSIHSGNHLHLREKSINITNINNPTTTSLSELQFSAERQQLIRAKQQTHSPVKLHFRHLSVDSFGEALELSPSILVLNGHGTYSASGDFVLAFESNCEGVSIVGMNASRSNASSIGSSDLFTMSRLRLLLAAMPRDKLPKLVFLNMCYSEHAAEVFIEVGVQHVIAVRKGMKISDKAARYFSKHLFTALFSGQTLQKAFDIAKANVQCSIDAGWPIALRDLHKSNDSIDTTSFPNSSPEPSPHQSPRTNHPSPKTSHNENSRLPESVKYVLLPLNNDHEVTILPTPPPVSNSVANTPTTPALRPPTPVTPLMAKSPLVVDSPVLISSAPKDASNSLSEMIYSTPSHSILPNIANRIKLGVCSMIQPSTCPSSPTNKRSSSISSHDKTPCKIPSFSLAGFSTPELPRRFISTTQVLKSKTPEVKRRHSESHFAGDLITTSIKPNILTSELMPISSLFRQTTEPFASSQPAVSNKHCPNQSLFSLKYWFSNRNCPNSTPVDKDSNDNLVDQTNITYSSINSKSDDTVDKKSPYLSSDEPGYNPSKITLGEEPLAPVEVASNSPHEDNNDDVPDDIDSHLPLECEKFVSRQVEIHRLMSLIQQYSFVNVFGEALIGKSSVVARAARYLQQRRAARSVFYISYKDFVSLAEQSNLPINNALFFSYVSQVLLAVTSDSEVESINPPKSLPSALKSVSDALNIVLNAAKTKYIRNEHDSEIVLFFDDFSKESHSLEICNSIIALLRKGRGTGNMVALNKTPNFKAVFVSSEPLSSSISAQTGIFAGSLCIGPLSTEAGVELVKSAANFLSVEQAKDLVLSCENYPCRIHTSLVKLLQEMAKIESLN